MDKRTVPDVHKMRLKEERMMMMNLSYNGQLRLEVLLNGHLEDHYPMNPYGLEGMSGCWACDLK